jgi:phage baseplate assembly protein W
MSGYSVKTPLKYDKADGPYAMNKSLKEVVKQNFKDLLLTNPGERIMDVDYGIGVKTLLFHQRTENVSEIDISSLILNKVSIYMPFLVISNIDISDNLDSERNAIFINIDYSIPSIKEEDAISLILNNTN